MIKRTFFINAFPWECLSRKSVGTMGVLQDPRVENQVRKVVEDFVKAWNLHDAHAFAKVFADDADFTNVAGKSAKGRQAIEDFHDPLFRSNFRNSHQGMEEVRIRMIRPDLASVDVVWTMTGATDSDGNPRPERNGLLSLIISSKKGSWFIDVMHNLELTRDRRA